MSPEEFFDLHPQAPSVLRVGDDLYLASARGAAQSHANRVKASLEEIKNPHLGPDDVDDDGPDGYTDMESDPDGEGGDGEGGEDGEGVLHGEAARVLPTQTYGKSKRK